jgi:hypothetical protein
MPLVEKDAVNLIDHARARYNAPALRPGKTAVCRNIMTEPLQSLETIEYRRVMPWLHLFRAVGLALRMRMLVLAALGTLLASAGSALIDALPFSRTRSEPELATRWPWEYSFGYSELLLEPSRLGAQHGGAGADLLANPAAVSKAIGNWRLVLQPARDVVEPALVLFNARATWPALADSVTRLLWMIVIWSIFGGAIARTAALEFAREQRVGIMAALRFSVSRFAGYFGAPLLPFTGVALVGSLCLVGGLLSRIPGAGPAILGALWGLELVFGLMMAVLLLGVAAGWPLMFAAISVQGTEGFDGLSRAYSYVLERPLYLLWQLLLVLVQGSVSICVVWWVARLVVMLAEWGVSWGSGGVETTQSLLIGSPELLVGQAASLSPPRGLGGMMAQGWMVVLATLVVGYVYSYFWTCATIVYFVLRRSVDANDFDEVSIEEGSERDDLLPLVGAAAMQEQQPQVPPGSAPVDLTP